MKPFWILWTYIGNYSMRPIEVESAESPQDAARQATLGFSDDFQQKATVYVFDSPPVFTKHPIERARLDTDGTAKGKTEIAARHIAGHCVQPGIGAESYTVRKKD